MNISAAFIKRPIGTSLLALALLLIGLTAWPLLPVAPLPQVDFPTIQVTGACPRQPRDHGFECGAAAGAPVFADSQPDADDVFQLAGHIADHLAV
jgi:hypothetical protein